MMRSVFLSINHRELWELFIIPFFPCEIIEVISSATEISITLLEFQEAGAEKALLIAVVFWALSVFVRSHNDIDS